MGMFSLKENTSKSSSSNDLFLFGTKKSSVRKPIQLPKKLSWPFVHLFFPYAPC